jgi:predicted nuclease of predicted toxin-antitoxin system
VRLLIDEDVPQSVADYFRERGHEVILVRETLLPGTPDAAIAAIGDQIEAIVVTWNHRDFQRLASRASIGTRQRFRRLGRISFRCSQSRGRARLEQLIHSIEFEYEQSIKQRDPRLIMEIAENFFKVLR